jgi:type I restriction enzyme S subunit
MEKLQPTLRFPEFKGGWDSYFFKDFIAKIESGWSPVCLSEAVNEGEWGSLKTTSVSWEGYFPYENKKLPANIEPRTKTEVVLDDILITRVGPFERVGVVAHVNKAWQHLMVSDNMFRIKLQGEIFPAFVPLVLGSFNVQASWKQKIAGLASAQVVINQQTIFSTLLRLPSKQEQTKIATFLSAVDEKLNLLKEKKTALEEYKKGIMQKIFSQEIRFKDDNGNDFAEWEEKYLADICSKKSSNISANKIEDNHGEFIIYGASGVLKKVDFYQEENDYVSIVKDGAGAGRLLYCKGKSSVLGTLEILSPKVNLHTYFLYCLLSNIDFVKYVAGSTIPHIYFKDYSLEKCGLPCMAEQTKIATFLSAIDEKIELVATQIEDTQEYKKGLLQGMFC